MIFPNTARPLDPEPNPFDDIGPLEPVFSQPKPPPKVRPTGNRKGQMSRGPRDGPTELLLREATMKPSPQHYSPVVAGTFHVPAGERVALSRKQKLVLAVLDKEDSKKKEAGDGEQEGATSPPRKGQWLEPHPRAKMSRLAKAPRFVVKGHHADMPSVVGDWRQVGHPGAPDNAMVTGRYPIQPESHVVRADRFQPEFPGFRYRNVKHEQFGTSVRDLSLGQTQPAQDSGYLDQHSWGSFGTASDVGHKHFRAHDFGNAPRFRFRDHEGLPAGKEYSQLLIERKAQRRLAAKVARRQRSEDARGGKCMYSSGTTARPGLLDGLVDMATPSVTHYHVPAAANEAIGTKPTFNMRAAQHMTGERLVRRHRAQGDHATADTILKLLKHDVQVEKRVAELRTKIGVEDDESLARSAGGASNPLNSNSLTKPNVDVFCDWTRSSPARRRVLPTNFGGDGSGEGQQQEEAPAADAATPTVARSIKVGPPLSRLISGDGGDE